MKPGSFRGPGRLMLPALVWIASLAGCLSSGGNEEDPALRDVTVTTRLEIVENQYHPDSLVDVHLALGVSRTHMGSRYRTRVDFAADRGFIRGYEDDSFASDTAMQFSWTFPQPISRLKGQTIRATVSLNGKAFARDSATFY